MITQSAHFVELNIQNISILLGDLQNGNRFVTNERKKKSIKYLANVKLLSDVPD